MTIRGDDTQSRPRLRVVGGGVAGLRAEMIQRTARWDEIEPDWRRLFAASPSATPPLRWEWLRAWWDVYGGAYADSEAGLRVVAIWEGADLVGALPLYAPHGRSRLEARRIAAIGTGEAQHEEVLPEYFDLLYAPGCGSAVASAVRRCVLDEAKEPWDELPLRHVSPDSPLREWNVEYVHPRPNPGTSRTCYVAGLAGGFDAYLERLSPNERGHVRRMLRDAAQDGLVLDVANDADTADRYLLELAALHQTRWRAAGLSGCFGAPRFLTFHRRLVRDLTPAGSAVVARLSRAAEPAALIYGFRERTRFYFYQTGMRREWLGALRSPGIAAHLLLMRALAEQGVEEYDFLCGDASYKERLATMTRELFDLKLVRPSMRTAARTAGLRLRESVRNLAPRRAA